MEISSWEIPDHKVILEEALIALRQKILSFFENIGKRLSISETYLMANSILFWLTAAKGKKGAIVAMIAGTKAQTVIAIIEKTPLKLRNTVSDITWHGSKHGIDC
jgi:hypothetical protein